jgi:hypothetical protein
MWVLLLFTRRQWWEMAATARVFLSILLVGPLLLVPIASPGEKLQNVREDASS